MARQASRSGSAAQGKTGSKPDPDPIQHSELRVIRVPCCKCVGGKGQTVDINTGSGAGSVAWRVFGPGVANPIAQTIAPGTLDMFWTASLPPAGWVHPDTSNGATNFPSGTYLYEINIEVPKCTIPMDVEVSGAAAGDDEVKVYVDNFGTPIASTPLNADPSVMGGIVAAGTGGWGFRAARILQFSQPLGPGMHTLRFEVTNAPESPHGLLVQAAIRTICSKELEQSCHPAY
jgi:hypothetical protein